MGYFTKEGVVRTLLGDEFRIDTGEVKLVYCRKPSYGPYESIVITEQITQLKSNNWIEQCGGPCGSMIILA